MKKLILTFTLMFAGIAAGQVKDGGPAVDSMVCGPVSVSESELEITTQGFIDSGCTVIHAREVSNLQWYLYGLRLTGLTGNAPPKIYPDGDICGPHTLSRSRAAVGVRYIAQTQGCTEIHVREVSATVWSAYGAKLTLF